MHHLIQAFIVGLLILGSTVLGSTAAAQTNSRIPASPTAALAPLSDSARGRLNPDTGLQYINQVGMKRCENAGIPRPPDFDCHHSLWQEIGPGPSSERRFIYLGQDPAGFCVLTAKFSGSWTGPGGAFGPVSITCTGATGSTCSWNRDTGSSSTTLHPNFQFDIVAADTGNGGFCSELRVPASGIPVELRRDNFSTATVTPP